MTPIRRVVLTDAARDDLTEVWVWIATHHPDAADRVVRRIAALLERLASMPEIVTVVRVLHGRRDVDGRV